MLKIIDFDFVPPPEPPPERCNWVLLTKTTGWRCLLDGQHTRLGGDARHAFGPTGIRGTDGQWVSVAGRSLALLSTPGVNAPEDIDERDWDSWTRDNSEEPVRSKNIPKRMAL